MLMSPHDDVKVRFTGRHSEPLVGDIIAVVRANLKDDEATTKDVLYTAIESEQL